MTYVPQPGTIPFRVIELLRSKPGEWLSSAVIADELNIDRNLGPYMTTPMRHGLVKAEKINGLNMWTLGDGKAVEGPLDDDDPVVQRVVGVDIDAAHRRISAAAQKLALPPATVEKHADDDIVRKTKPTRFGLWSDETLQIESACGKTLLLSPDDTKGLARYLSRHVEVRN